MTGIQFILIGGVLVIFLYYYFRLRNAFLDLVVLSLFSAGAIYAILFPESTSAVAEKLGVGRGADLLFYTCILFFLFIILKLFARIRRLENTVTQLVRQQAKGNAVQLTETPTEQS
jgi:hypothetical protein